MGNTWQSTKSKLYAILLTWLMWGWLDSPFRAVRKASRNETALPQSGFTKELKMGGQGVERRDILRFVGIASVAGGFPGFSKWAFACCQAHVHAPVGPTARAMPGPYKPLFFSPQHYHMVEHLAEMIIPADDTPGAKQAGVAAFIDFMVANRVPVSARRDVRSTQDAIAMGNEAQNRFLAGLDRINARRKSKLGHKFLV